MVQTKNIPYGAFPMIMISNLPIFIAAMVTAVLGLGWILIELTDQRRILYMLNGSGKPLPESAIRKIRLQRSQNSIDGYLLVCVAALLFLLSCSTGRQGHALATVSAVGSIGTAGETLKPRYPSS